MGNKSFVFRFADVEVREREFALIKAGKVLAVEPKAFRTLLFLLHNPQRLISKEELLNSLWGDAAVTEGSLTRCIWLLRRLLEDDIHEPRYIETVATVGYRFVCQVEVSEVSGYDTGGPVAEASATPETPATGETKAKTDQPSKGTRDRNSTASANQERVNASSDVRATLPARPFSAKRILASLSVLLILAAGFLGYRALSNRARHTAKPPSRSALASTASTAINARTFPLTTLQGSIEWPGHTFSPDARQIAFVWKGEIYVQLIGGDRPLQITHSQTGDIGGQLDWSPDGRLIVFSRCGDENRGALYTISPLGGVEHKVADVACSPWAVWTPDGQSLVFSDTCSVGGPAGIVLLSLATGSKRCLVASDSNTVDLLFPRVSPDGSTVAYLRSPTMSVGDTYAVSIAGGTPRRLTFEGKFGCVPMWSRDGQYIVLGSDRGGMGYQLWKVPAKGGPIEPETIYPHYGSVSRDGRRLAYVENGRGEHEGIWRAQLSGPGGKVLSQEKIFDSKAGDMAPQLSPDGRQIAFMSGISGTGNTWRIDADGSNSMQLTSFSGELNGTPRWSPDGKWIVFDRRPADHAQIYVIDAEGRNMRAITDGAYDDNVPTWSRDGKSIYFSSNRTGQWQMWKHDLGSGVEAQITQHGGFSAFESYDGRYLYYVKSSTPGIWRMPVGGGEDQRVTDQPAGYWGVWDVTETGLYFFNPGAKPRPRFAFYDFKTHLVTNVFEPEGELWTGGPVLSASRDGRTVFYSQQDPTSTIKIVENFQ